MVDGMIGKKLGMVQIFDESGHAIGVTVVEAGPCTVIQKRENSKIQLGYGETKESRVNKPRLGVFKKAGTAAFKMLKEFSARIWIRLKSGRRSVQTYSIPAMWSR